ncbi:YihY/virulence factor BrkB family protein [Clostridium kluyveri]|uniref:Ribonuclease BN n=1 Tax=Clostridium kluyveri TaxID=1534 RepID=A0A1L5FD31_CLOKL|nr:YihY/virulence factor BrkB family protein [Clostridium kluyveri]APM40720.1 ribonuclease BN [Clostridium kluyveri]UZQ49178.1 YihY/virulence factor BrkB family protein [Clostridium kluyveri]
MKKNSLSFNGLKAFIFRFIEDDVLALASQLAYSLIFSFFPFLIFIISIIGYSDISSSNILSSLSYILPENILQLIKTTIIRITDTRDIKLLFSSLALTIWSSSGGFHSVIKGLNKAYNKKESRSVLKIYAISMVCTLGITVIIIITILLLVFGRIIGSFLAFNLGFSKEFNFMWNIFRYLMILFSTIFIFSAVYRYTPNVKLRWREVMPGAFFSTVGIVIASMGFAFYVNNFANYSIIYGSIGAAIMLMTWLFILSVITILGGEINSVLFTHRIK